MTDIDIRFCFSLETSIEKERKTYFSNIDRVNHIRTHRRNSDKGEVFGTWSAWLPGFLYGLFCLELEIVYLSPSSCAGDWATYRSQRSAELTRGLASWQAGRSENLFRIHCVSENQDCPLKRFSGSEGRKKFLKKKLDT